MRVLRERDHALGHRVYQRLHLVALASKLGEPRPELVGQSVEGGTQLIQLGHGDVARSPAAEVSGSETAGPIGQHD